jgi:hypothetical protein
MLKKFLAMTAVLASGAAANAVVSLSTSSLGNLGGDLWGADVLISVSPSTDDWTVGGVSGTTTQAGVVHNYADAGDPNGPALTNPGGGGTPGNPVCFVNVPQGQFSTKRFGTAGAASIVGAYLPAGPSAVATAGTFNVAYAEVPPVTSLDSGAIARVVIDLAGSAYAGRSDIYVATSPNNPTDIMLATYRVASGTVQDPAPLTEVFFSFWTVPEPSSLALLVLGGLVAWRRR